MFLKGDEISALGLRLTAPILQKKSFISFHSNSKINCTSVCF